MFLSSVPEDQSGQDLHLAPLQLSAVEVVPCAKPSPGTGLNGCQSPDALRKWLREFARGLGFYGGRYLHLGHLPCTSGHGERDRPIRFLSTATSESATSEADAWLFDDPSIAAVRSSFEPFAWSTRGGVEMTQGQRDWLDSERARGIGAGIALPVQDYLAGPAYLSLFGVDEAQAVLLLEERAPELAFTAARFHALAKMLLPIADTNNAPPILTHREIECLRLAAIGWTVSASAAALGIAGRTVEFHLGNAVGKLSAVNKIHAVAIATSGRLIAV